MAVKIHSGMFNKRVVFKQPIETKNNEGGREIAYPTSTITTWAYVKPINQVRALEADSTALIGSMKVGVRYRANTAVITKDWLLVIDGVEHVLHSHERVNYEKDVIEFIAKSKTT